MRMQSTSSVCKGVLFALLVVYQSHQSQAFLSPSRNERPCLPSSHRIHATRTSATPSTKIPRSSSIGKSTVTFIDPPTNVEIVLLGCFHGSQSSARDVEELLLPENGPTNAVILELCASRFSDMRKYMNEPQNNLSRKPWIVRFVSMVTKLTESRGLSSGIASAVLGLASGWQTALAGLEPGLEFRTAVTHNPVGSDIILADQSVDETLQKIGDLPSQSLNLFRQALDKGWEDSFGVEADALGTALFGSNRLRDHQLTVPAFLTRSPDAIKDLLRLSVAPLIGLQAINILVSTGSHVAIHDAAIPEHSQLVMTLSVLAGNITFLLLMYLSVALPAARVVLRERDDRLSEGIRAACRVVAQDNQIDETNQGRVVAVLGLLHVNGVARRLLSGADQDETDLEGH